MGVALLDLVEIALVAKQALGDRVDLPARTRGRRAGAPPLA